MLHGSRNRFCFCFRCYCLGLESELMCSVHYTYHITCVEFPTPLLHCLPFPYRCGLVSSAGEWCTFRRSISEADGCLDLTGKRPDDAGGQDVASKYNGNVESRHQTVDKCCRSSCCRRISRVFV